VVRTSFFFATDRNDERGGEIDSRFGSHREDDQQFSCGSVGFRSEASAASTKSLILEPSTLPNNQQQCLTYISQGIQSQNVSDVLLYIHGFRTPFRTALESGMKLAESIQYKGAVLVWSWPSDGRTKKYPRDEVAIEWSRPHLTNFVTKLKGIGIARIDVVAHSMGSRLARELVKAIANDSSAPFPECVVFYAADDDQAIFARDLKDVTDAANAAGHRPYGRATVYTADWDWALRSSQEFHTDPRVGQGADDVILVRNQFETIEASWLKGGFWGHDYLFEDPKGSLDLHRLIVQKLGARGRTLEAKQAPNGLVYWLLK
jgi:esterase/lipase superfamily enzyme